MDRSLTWFISRISLLIVIYLVLFFSYSGIRSNYYEGDSLNYHIPIAKAYLEGNIWNPEQIKGVQFLKYSPGSNEGILAALLALGIPINIFNVIGMVALFVVCFFAGKRFALDKDLSIIFAASIVTLHSVLRWTNTQVIDIWLAVWFVLSLALLQRVEKSLKYFVFIGFSAGMLVGSKYTGPLFLIILAVFYFRREVKALSPKRIIVFLIPFTFFGLLWYFRNFLLTANPIYPQPFLFFTGDYYPILETNVWKAALLVPGGIIKVINALISEYTLWGIAVFVPLLLLFKKIRSPSLKVIRNLILIGILNFTIFLLLPSDKYYNIVVSVFRYSYPAFVTFILAVFLLAKKIGRDELILVFALTNMLFITGFGYSPKITLIMLPIALIIFFPDKVVKLFKSKSNKANLIKQI